MSLFKTLLNAVLNPIDYHVVRTAPYALDAQLRRLFARLGVDCVLDVGAHWGEYGRFLRDRVGYRGRIVSFEPMAESVGKLRAAAAGDPEWRVVHAALGEASREAELNVYDNTVFNSLLPVSEYAGRTFGGSVAARGTERITVRALDELFAEATAGLPRGRVYLKLDTQGYDQQVLDGAVASLPRVVGLQSEVPVSPVYEGAPDLAQAVTRLQQLGFGPVGLFPVTREGDGVHVVEFDCVMARRPLPG